MNPRALLPALILVALLAAGCTDDPSRSAPPPTATAALVAPEALASYVPPAPAGWRLVAPPSAAVLEENGTVLVSATASYLADDGARSADLVLQDTGGRPVGIRRLADTLAAAPGAPAPEALGGRLALVLEDGGVTSAYLVLDDRLVAWIAVPGGTRTDLEPFAAALDPTGPADGR